jgi:Domain of unknown function (DUF5076)
MTIGEDDPRVYRALALPEKALENGGLEILRLGIIDDELYVSALPAFEAPAQWGEVLAEVSRRLGAIYAAQKTGLNKKDVTVQIVEAFAAVMGAKPVKAKPGASPTKARRAARKSKKIAKQAARPAARRKKR